MLKAIRQARLTKLNRLLEPFPAKVQMGFTKGRLRSIRKHGGSIFAHLDTQQIFFEREKLGEKKFNEFRDLFDIGDIIEVSGQKFITKTGETTIMVKDFQMLAKALRPLPDKWSGLEEKEIRFRNRYLDILMNKATGEIFKTRAEILKVIRDFLNKNDFLEVETPILQPLYGGASAQPFKTHLNALNLDLFLRVAPELYLKRLLVGGWERVYEIARCFRNEGMDREHNPDFTMLEFYVAYWDWEEMMSFTEKLMENFGFVKNWDRVEYREIVKGNKDAKAAYKKLKKPTFVLGLPNIPLAKKGQALQGVVAGMEIIKIFSEQNNPLEQKKAFLAQKKTDEIQPLDKDFIEALEYGMPPAAGFGMGLDRLTMLLTSAKTLREAILFPIMKPKSKKDKIYY